MEKMIYTKFSNERNPIFKVITEIVSLDHGQKMVKKIPYSAKSVDHVKNIHKWSQKLETRFEKVGIKVNKCSLENNIAYLEYVQGKSLENILDEYMEAYDKDSFFDAVEMYITNIKSAYDLEVFKPSKEFEEVFGKVEFSGTVMAVRELNVDMIFSNVIIKEGVSEIIDYEWTFDFLVPLNYLFYRAIRYYLLNSPKRQKFFGDSPMEVFGIKRSEITLFEEMEHYFQSNYVFKDFDSTYSLYDKFGKESVVVDYNQKEAWRTACMFQVYYDFGKGFNLEESESFRVSLDSKGIAVLELLVPKNTRNVRIRIGNEPCTAKIVKITSGHESGSNLKYKANATYTSLRGEYLFLSSEPYIDIKVANKNIDKINLLAEIDIVDMETDRRRLGRLLAHVRLISFITTPLGKLYNVLKKSNFFRLVYTVLRFIKREGIGAALNRGRLEIRKKINRIKGNSRILKSGKYRQVKANDSDLNNTAILEKIDKTIGVHLHLYYEELLEEMLKYLSNIPYSFDLYISCTEYADVKNIKEKSNEIDKAKKVIIKKVENRGRDIKPLFIDFRKEIMAYDYFIHIHTKKSLYSDRERVSWRRHSLESLLGSKELVGKLFSLLEHNSKLGILYPDNYEDVPMLAYTWLANERGGRQFLDSLNIEFEGGIFSYPAGSFYLAKTKALKPLFDLNLSPSEFQEEQGQTDGTLAHIIERATGFVVTAQGYEKGIVDYQEGVVRYGFSNKAFRPYFHLNVQSVKVQLKDYDVISFDVFDTLITRCVLKPDDLFHLMEKIISKKYSMELEYLSIRKKAEFSAYERKGDYTNIYDIYDEMKKISGIEASLVNEFRELEIKLEHEMSIPRRDVLDIFNYLRGLDKKIILVSDMYLTKDIIVSILEKCGYTGFDEIYVSSELGLRKDKDTIWDKVITDNGRGRFIHVGDNPRSDWQTLVDRRMKALYIMSSYDQFKMTDLYDNYSDRMYNSVYDSIFWGLIINAGLCNSPFSLKGEDGELIIQDIKGVGISIFAPILYMFTEWLIRTTKEEEYLAFLSREGFLLEKLYDRAVGKHNVKRKGAMYFLSSRRAATVAASQTWEDITQILKGDYKGSIINLAKVRLGIDLEGLIEDKEIDLAESEAELKQVISKLQPFEEKIMDRCGVERESYLKYLESQVPKEDWGNLAVIDVGYAGTIQYNLAKMINEKVRGYYLITRGKTKPEKIGCPVEVMTVPGEPFMTVVDDTHLFLESVLSAPYGQFINFDMVEGEAVPRYRLNDLEMSDELKEMQESILWYVETISALTQDIFEIDDFESRMNLTKDVYGKFMETKGLLKKMGDVFAIDDNYCRNGKWVYDPYTKQWKLVQLYPKYN